MRSVLWWGTGLVVVASGCFVGDVDSDGDGFLDKADCAPNDPAVFPGAAEDCNGVDDDCDGTADNNIDRIHGTAFYVDEDADGYGVAGTEPIYACEAPHGHAARTGDCDDRDPTLSPETVWYKDYDHDGWGDPDLDNAIVECWGRVGFVANSDDCRDDDPEIRPFATEVCNGEDDNCDGAVDEGLLVEYYLDSDEDGFGSVNVTAESTIWGCPPDPDAEEEEDDDDEDDEDAPVYSLVATDCDDGDENIHPDADRVCGDGIDNACDDLLGVDISSAHCAGELKEAEVRIIGAHPGEAFGSSITVLRDLYAPGDDFVAVGAPAHELASGEVPGAVWVFRLEDLLTASPEDGWIDPSDPVAASGVLIHTGGALDELSSGLSAAGDFDGDGWVDLAIGAHRFDTEDLDASLLPDQDGTSRSGGLFLISGADIRAAGPGDVIEAEPHLLTYGAARADWVGGSVGAGDLNGDGVADVVTGATGVSGLSSSGGPLDLVGGVAVVFGTSADADPVAISSLSAAGRGAWVGGVDEHQYTVGQSLAVGDLNSDGVDDLVVGVVKSNSETGAVYVLHGPVEDDTLLLDDADTVLHGADSNGSFGNVLAIQPADPSCDALDGHSTLFVGAHTTGYEGFYLGGAVYAFDYAQDASLRGAVDSAPDRTSDKVTGNTPEQQMGFRLTAGGHVDDTDCIPDLVITGAFNSADGGEGDTLVFQGPIAGKVTAEHARANLESAEVFGRSGWSHAFARAPSLEPTEFGPSYPGHHDAILVGADRFDRDPDPDEIDDDVSAAPRLDAGAVHIFTSLGY